MSAEKLLVLVLRFDGVLLLCALPFALLPTTVMAAVHSWLGLGDLPRHLIVEYLTRSLSLLYASWGPLFVYLATDVRRYRDLILFIAYVRLAFAMVLLVVDVWAGMPWFWTAAEGPGIAVFSLVTWMLARQLK